MKVTKNWLVKHNACSDGMSFVNEHKLIGTDECYFIRQLVKLDKHEWALWLLVRRLDRKDRIRFAVYCAKDVLPIYEAEYPDDDRPRKAIEAAEACIADNTQKNRDAARAAADAAADAVRAASWAVWAVWAARAAEAAAEAASWAVWGASWAASWAVWGASWAARAAKAAAEAASNDQSAMCRYIEYGVGLLEGCE